MCSEASSGESRDEELCQSAHNIVFGDFCIDDHKMKITEGLAEDLCDTCSEGSKDKSEDTTGGSSTADLCDTASVDSDDGWDAISLCSWTTDQGEFNDFESFERYMPTLSGGEPSNNTCLPPYVDATSTSSPIVVPNCAPSEAVQMFVAYAPALVPVVAVPCVYPYQAEDYGFATMWNGMNFPESEANFPRFGQQPFYQKKHWAQGPAAPPGVWNRTPPAARRGRGTLRGAKAATRSAVPNSGNSEKTTVILRNLPIECTRDVLLQIMDDEGFGKELDFLHVPVDFQTWRALGYAILNLVSHDAALRVQEHFAGFQSWPCPSDHVCEVDWNSGYQGLSAHIDRYRNSPLMHFSVAEEYRPVFFKNGTRMAFPAPTIRIRPPRIRHQKPETIIETED